MLAVGCLQVVISTPDAGVPNVGFAPHVWHAVLQIILFHALHTCFHRACCAVWYVAGPLVPANGRHGC